jgi:demethylmenaquinone methyltransferase/2-methoxy-6-polyprenyl-1,4-benzoquinol methylase
VNRRLNDGREFRIVKIFYQPAELTRQLAELAWDFQIAQTPSYFIYGSGSCKNGKE